MMLAGGFTVMAGMIAAAFLLAIGVNHPLAVFAPVTFVGLGNGLALPSANAGIVSVRPKLAGAASGLGGFLQVGGGAAMSALAGLVLTPQSGPLPLILLMLLCATLSVVATLLVIRASERGVAEDDRA
jgi:DHA1 family bicyclomycin/chloramphenicol resistance-like MFS transporter